MYKIASKLQYAIRYSTKAVPPLSYWHEVSSDPLRALTVGLLLEEIANKYPDREAIISCHPKKSVTFVEMIQEADKFAAGLHKLGLEKTDRIGIWAPNVWQWYLSKMACARGGFVMVGLNPLYQPPEIEYCINKVGIKGMIIGETFKTQDYHKHLVTIAPELVKSEPGKLKSAKVPSLKTIVMISDSPKSGTFAIKEVQKLGADSVANIKKNQTSIQPDSRFNIQFTSGTTGQSKAAMISHFNMVNNGFFCGKRQELWSKHHKLCMQVPFFHGFGLTITLMAALNHGASLVIPGDGYNPHNSLDAIKNEKCTVIHGTPTMYVDLVHVQEERKEDISPEIALTAGAICSQQLFQGMLKHLKLKKVKSVYGLSETTAAVFGSMIEEDEHFATATVGRVLDHGEAKVVDENGEMVPLGTPGELLVRCYNNMLGYWDDEKRTKEMIQEDRWLRTGDQFVFFENGYGNVVGRLKDMIIRGGENIYPKEIEEFINHHPKILECQVIGVPHERLGEEVCIFIRTKQNADITLDEIKQFCDGKLAPFKVPSMLRIVDDFPKTTSGKIQKYKLLEQIKQTKSK